MKNKSYKKQIMMIILSACFAIAGNVYAQDMTPKFIKAGITDDPTTKKTITWMTDQPSGTSSAIMKIAKKSDGAGSFVNKTGTVMNYKYNSTPAGGTDINKTLYSVTVTGLAPGTTYIYQVGNGTTWSATKEFTTTTATDKYSFFVFGDIQATGTNTTTYVNGGTRFLRDVADKYKNAATKPLFTVQVGDVVDREHVYGFYSPFGDVCDAYPEFGNTDFLACMGNHEYYNRGSSAILNSSTSGSGATSKFLYGYPAQNTGNTGTGTYSVNYGNMHIIALDFQGRDADIGSSYATSYMDAMATWLRNDLTNNKQPWKIVVLHYVIWHRDYGDTNLQPYQADMKAKFSPIFDEFGVQLVFQGHTHNVGRVQVKNKEFKSNMLLNSKPYSKQVQPDAPIYITCGSMTKFTKDDNPDYPDYDSVYLNGTVDGKKMNLKMIDHLGTIVDEINITADGTTDKYLTLSLSSSETSNVYIPNTQEVGKTVYLWMYDNTGDKANNFNSTLTSSDTSVAEIDGYGKITTKKAGTTTIKAVRDGGINGGGLKDGAQGTLSLTVTGVTTYTITASAGSNGTISPNGNVTVNQGSNQAFTFTPSAGYEINQVLVNGVNNATAVSSGTYTFTNVTSNHTISVTFKQKQYTITASAGSNGAISPNGNVTVNHGNNQTFTITPSANYDIDQVLVDGANNATAVSSGTYTFTNVTSNRTISATFKQKSSIDSSVKDEINIYSTKTGIAVDFVGNAAIELYTVSGILIDKVQAAQFYSRDLSGGVYILRVNGQTKKFVK